MGFLVWFKFKNFEQVANLKIYKAVLFYLITKNTRPFVTKMKKPHREKGPVHVLN